MLTGGCVGLKREREIMKGMGETASVDKWLCRFEDWLSKHAMNLGLQILSVAFGIRNNCLPIHE